MNERLKNTTTCVEVNLYDLWFLESLLNKTQENIAREHSFIPHEYENLTYYKIITRLLEATQSAYDEAKEKGEYYGIEIQERDSK